MDILLPFFQLLYVICHFLYSLGQAVVDAFYEIYQIIGYLYMIIWKPVTQNIQLQTLGLKRRPKHVALVFVSSPTNSVQNITQILQWAVSYGVKVVSLFDPLGNLKRQRSNLENYLNKSCPTLRTKFMCKHSCYSDINYLSYDLMVNILSTEDGRMDIVHAARNAICDDISENFISTRLITCNQPEPDVVIVIGRTFSMVGFLPWQIRLSELYMVPSLKRLSCQQYYKIMKQYSECNQRFGK